MKNFMIFIAFFTSLSINAQTLLIDDFKSGALSTFQSNTIEPVLLTQSGNTILGSNRLISAATTVKYGQNMSVAVLPQNGLMVVSGGYGASFRVELH